AMAVRYRPWLSVGARRCCIGLKVANALVDVGINGMAGLCKVAGIEERLAHVLTAPIGFAAPIASGGVRGATRLFEPYSQCSGELQAEDFQNPRRARALRCVGRAPASDAPAPFGTAASKFSYRPNRLFCLE